VTTETHEIGEVTRLTLDVQADVGGSPNLAPADPGALTFTMVEPNGDETVRTEPGSPGIDGHLSQGGFYVDWTWRMSGRHFWRWTGTGQGAGTFSGEAWVKRSNAGTA
jgi:hypothetical protein